jgi:hypothetical protein
LLRSASRWHWSEAERLISCASARSRNKLDVERDRDAASRPTADTNLTHFPGR